MIIIIIIIIVIINTITVSLLLIFVKLNYTSVFYINTLNLCIFFIYHIIYNYVKWKYNYRTILSKLMN